MLVSVILSAPMSSSETAVLKLDVEVAYSVQTAVVQGQPNEAQVTAVTERNRDDIDCQVVAPYRSTEKILEAWSAARRGPEVLPALEVEVVDCARGVGSSHRARAVGPDARTRQRGQPVHPDRRLHTSHIRLHLLAEKKT